jgi:hypothetical protein
MRKNQSSSRFPLGKKCMWKPRQPPSRSPLGKTRMMHYMQKTKSGLPDKKSLKCRPQGGSPPSLRPRTRICHHFVPSTTPTAANPHSIASAGPSRSGTTVTADAAPACVAIPELPKVVVAPALDAPVVLRSAASSSTRRMGLGACGVVSSRPRIVPLTCQQRCWRHVSAVLRLLLSLSSVT